MDTLTNISESVREETGIARKSVLHKHLRLLSKKLPKAFRLPIDPAVELCTIQVVSTASLNRFLSSC
jgi:pilus assembly protein TadC